MRPASDRIVLRGLRGQGRHGWFDFEREQGQPFVVDLTLHLDLAPAARSDNLADTVDYGALGTQVVAVIEGEPVLLIETLAERIADCCLSDPRVERVDVVVHKPQAPMSVPFGDVEVHVSRARS
jgi:dihydroneopterin aldolase